jgi:hypothetical protein
MSQSPREGGVWKKAKEAATILLLDGMRASLLIDGAQSCCCWRLLLLLLLLDGEGTTPELRRAVCA